MRPNYIVSSNGEQKVSGGDSLHGVLLRQISCQFQNLGSDVLKDRSAADRSRSADSVVRGDTFLEEPVNSSDRELRLFSVDSGKLKAKEAYLQTGLCRPALWCAL